VWGGGGTVGTGVYVELGFDVKNPESHLYPGATILDCSTAAHIIVTVAHYCATGPIN